MVNVMRTAIAIVLLVVALNLGMDLSGPWWAWSALGGAVGILAGSP